VEVILVQNDSCPSRQYDHQLPVVLPAPYCLWTAGIVKMVGPGNQCMVVAFSGSIPLALILHSWFLVIVCDRMCCGALAPAAHRALNVEGLLAFHNGGAIRF
jgi:hypothetical protein